jgi:hypothetical protein
VTEKLYTCVFVVVLVVFITVLKDIVKQNNQEQHDVMWNKKKTSADLFVMAPLSM